MCRATPWRRLLGRTASSTRWARSSPNCITAKPARPGASQATSTRSRGGDQAGDLRGVVGPAQAGLDQVARHLRHGRARPAPGQVEAGSRPRHALHSAKRGCVVRQRLQSAHCNCMERKSDERRRKPGPHPGRQRRRRLLHQPRHLRDALRRRARPSRRACAACSACSRAWSPARPTATAAWPSRPAATLLHLGPGPGQRPGQPAQRAEGALGHRQHRRRPRDLPPRATTRR